MPPRVHTPIPLDTGWEAEYFELEPDLYEWAAAPQPVARLSRWQCAARYDETWAVVLSTRFDVPPIDEVCLHFVLHLAHAPGPVTLYLNGRRLGEIDGREPFALDVTDFITLEDNRLQIRIECACFERGERFGPILLQRVECEPPPA
jgi:hypothetical protein